MSTINAPPRRESRAGRGMCKPVHGGDGRFVRSRQGGARRPLCAHRAIGSGCGRPLRGTCLTSWRDHIAPSWETGFRRQCLLESDVRAHPSLELIRDVHEIGLEIRIIDRHDAVKQRLRELHDFSPSPDEPSVWLPRSPGLLEVNFLGMDPAQDPSEAYVLDDDQLPLLVFGALSLVSPENLKSSFACVLCGDRVWRRGPIAEATLVAGSSCYMVVYFCVADERCSGPPDVR